MHEAKFRKWSHRTQFAWANTNDER